MNFTTVLTTDGNGISLQTYFDKGNISFNRIEIGSGINVNPKESTALANKQLVGRFLGIERNDEKRSAILKFTFDNKEVVEGFEFLEYGIWATYTTASGEKIDCLYAYGYSNSGKGTEIPAFTGSKSYIKDNLNVALEIGSPDTVNVYLGEYEDYVSKESFQEHLNDEKNPHNVTKEQIGLGDVENVSIDDAVPVADQSVLDVPAKDIQQYGLQPGDKVSVLWAKTKRAISDLFSHLKDYKNPHNVTFEQLTGVASLNDLLKKIITDGNQNIELRNGRYLRGQSTDGKAHTLIGLGTDNNVYIGNDESQYAHLHAKGFLCFRTENPTTNIGQYWGMNSNCSLYPYQIPKGGTNQANNGSTIGLSSRRVGTIYATNALNTSDAKLKENISDAEIGMEILKKLSIVQFNFIGEREVKCGVIAQVVFELFQELDIHNSGVYQASVKENNPDEHPELENLTDDEILKYDDTDLTWNVDYNSLTYYCIAGFKAYMHKNDTEISEIKRLLTEVLNNG